MRLNIFLPSSVRQRLPGPLAALLRLLGPSWQAAPVRRVVQALCLAGFLVLLLFVCRLAGSAWPARDLASRELLEAELFLRLDPLVGIVAGVAARTLLPALLPAAAVLVVCLVFPRGFCGYVCPLGTIIDLFDWLVGRHFARLHLSRRGWLVRLRYYVLGGIVLSALLGVSVGGALAAIPIVTRAVAYVAGPVQVDSAGGRAGPGLSGGHYLALGLFAAVLCLGLLGRRFWCRCLCPTGAVFSLASAARLTERKVGSNCIRCGRCVEACPFDAINPDFTTRWADCTFCEVCGGVCPVGAISFTGRWNRPEGERIGAVSGGAVLSRREVLAGGVAAVAAAAGVGGVARAVSSASKRPLRPPGSCPEGLFLRLCVRCGECINACPTGLLEPMGPEAGLSRLWTPEAATEFSGCMPQCNVCGQVCPTGAIRPLSLAEKRATRMGLAVVDKKACLPWAGRQDCRLCVEACEAAGYGAIEYRLVHPELDERGLPVEGSGFLAPAVLAEKCVGCGLCQSRCRAINVEQRHLLPRAAIRVSPLAGHGGRNGGGAGSVPGSAGT